MIKLFCTFFMSITITVLLAQGVAINSTKAAPDSSALLDISSTKKGLLPPRMTTTDRISIFNPAKGLLVYDTDKQCLFIYGGIGSDVGWKEVRSLNDLLKGGNVGDVIRWDGNKWVVGSTDNLLHIFYGDKDGDGFGDRFKPLSLIEGSVPPADFVNNNTDCNDDNSTANPNAAEICNGVDDDCDGQIDEGTPGGGQSCNTGQLGACAAGVTACMNGAIVCVPLKQPSAEVCNGIDDDCDGQIDEGNPGGGQSCNTGQLGACASGVTTCMNGAFVCVSLKQPSAEICNGIDDDCDGQIDEGNPGGGQSCNTGKPGVCAAGITVCQAGAIVCVQNLQPSSEKCNGLDDNCNGIVDEACTGTKTGPVKAKVLQQDNTASMQLFPLPKLLYYEKKNVVKDVISTVGNREFFQNLLWSF